MSINIHCLSISTSNHCVSVFNSEHSPLQCSPAITLTSQFLGVEITYIKPGSHPAAPSLLNIQTPHTTTISLPPPPILLYTTVSLSLTPHYPYTAIYSRHHIHLRSLHSSYSDIVIIISCPKTFDALVIPITKIALDALLSSSLFLF